MVDEKLAERLAVLLDELREIDEPSVRNLLHQRIPVRRVIADRLGFVAWDADEAGPGRPPLGDPSLTVLGILNAACGVRDETDLAITCRVEKQTGRIDAIYLKEG